MAKKGPRKHFAGSASSRSGLGDIRDGTRYQVHVQPQQRNAST